MKFLKMSSKITIEIIPEFQNPFLKNLNPDDYLSDIRKQLIIDDTLLFSEGEFDKIKYEDEEKFRLKEIIIVKGEQNLLYLKQIYWKFFNNIHELDYGCTMSIDGIKKANKRAFIMKD